MAQIDAKIRLRPTRIGFLLRPSDRAALRKILLSGPCIWGGALNPIIPVNRTTPKAWSHAPRPEISALEVARGYVGFFEPDVFVHAQPSLLAQIAPTEDVGQTRIRNASPMPLQITPTTPCRRSAPGQTGQPRRAVRSHLFFVGWPSVVGFGDEVDEGDGGTDRQTRVSWL